MPSILDGFNVTCFAYGMTGAGKTHTMIGSNTEITNEDSGLCYHAVQGIFSHILER